MKKKYFEEQAGLVKKSIEKYKNITNKISLMRLFFFLLSLVLLIYGVIKGNIISILISLIILMVFFIFIKQTQKYYDLFRFYNVKYMIIQDYLSRYDLNFRNFDDGTKYKEENIFSNDLHLIGKSSLYQFINIAKSPYGKRLVLNDLLLKNINLENILSMQDTAHDISSNKEYVIEFNTYLSQGFRNDNKSDTAYDTIFANIKNTSFQVDFKFIIRLALPFIAIVLFILGIYKVIPFTVSLIAYILNVILYFLNALKTNEVLEDFKELDNINKVEKILLLTNEQKFNSKLLQDIKADSLKYVNELKNHHKLISAISLRGNLIFTIFANLLFSYDAFLILYISKMERDYKKYYVLLAKLEEIISMNTINLIYDNISIPKITSFKEIKGKDLYHPLISNPVSNSFLFPFDNYIITGSNMSGKTTFMRTIGINLVLTFCGSMVCASEFNTPLFNILTSISLQDDLSQGISSFYAEILRIKEIVKSLEKPGYKIIMVDEIFRGTNSLDRIEGAKALINLLKRQDVLSIFTTHDFELCDDFLKVRNYHFEEYYEQDQIRFDYILKQGRSQTTNAIYLMRMAGIIKSKYLNM